jgi:hypothetical protein
MNCSITTLTIPSTVTKLGTLLFNNNTTLTQLTVPFVGTTATSGNAFSTLCGSVSPTLKTVTINGGLIAANAFKDLTNITTVNFNSGITEIGNNAFEGCTGLTSVVLPSTCTKLGTSVFKGCTNIEKADLHYVTVNGYGILENCNKLAWLEIEHFGLSSAFPNNDYLSDIFYATTSANERAIPTTLETIVYYGTLRANTNNGDFSFGNGQSYTSIKTIILKGNITEIPAWTFRNLTNLQRIVIPASVTTIVSQAFSGVTNSVCKIFFEGTSVQWNNAASWLTYITAYTSGQWSYGTDGLPKPN